MADAFIEVHQVTDALLARKGAEELVVVCLLLGRTRRVVVEEQDDVLRVDDALAAHLIERLDRLVVEIVDARPLHLASGCWMERSTSISAARRSRKSGTG